MGDDALHELSAAYALDALDPADEAAFEDHLARCPRCREEVAAFSATASALALAAEPAEPPAALRASIIEAARAQRPNVVPLRPRWASPVGAVAAVAACVAVGLGIWNVTLQNRPGQTSALRSVPVKGANGSVVLDGAGDGALVVSNLAAAPSGKTYEAWVIQGGAISPAGLFGGGKTVVVPLAHRVPHGAIVGVTVERAGGSASPTSEPFITSVAA